MARSNRKVQRPLKFFLNVSKWFWAKRSLVWSTILVGLALEVLAVLPFMRANWMISTSLGWLFTNPDIILLIGFALLLLVLVTYIINSIQARTPTSLRDYLEHIVLREGNIPLTKASFGLVGQEVRLADVFIPLNFHRSEFLVNDLLLQKEFRATPEGLKDTPLSEDFDRLLFGSEQSGYSPLKGIYVNLSELWQQLSKEHPAAIIQGFPGMGKSALLARLALYMARTSLSQPDLAMQDPLKPSLIPILFHLDDYVTTHPKLTPPISFTDCLQPTLRGEGADNFLDQYNASNIVVLLQKYLGDGRCLVMFDGLDEINDRNVLWQVYNAIQDFIMRWSTTSKQVTFNRFLIASRLPNSEMGSLAKYPQYVINKLTSQQIEEFLPRWFKASESRDYSLRTIEVRKEDLTRVARSSMKNARILTGAIKKYQGVRELAKIPLFLTFLAIIQQNNIEAYKRKIDIYDVITNLLLRNNINIQQIDPIPEMLAVECLGLLAYRMQEKGESLIHQREAVDLLRKVIEQEGDYADITRSGAEDFLKHLSQQTGLFVKRAGDYYGFFHRTLQEYFAARYVLSTFKDDTVYRITSFIEKTRKQDDLWREPFLLAVAYDSGRSNVFADRIIRNLLEVSSEADFDERQHDLLLAAECLIESETLSIARSVEKEIAQRLLTTYQEAHRLLNMVVCEQIQKIILRWLLSLPKEIYRSTLLVTLCETLANKQDPDMQYATLMLLARIAHKMKECPSIVFDELLPVLLDIIDTSNTKMYQLSLPSSIYDPVLADLSLTILSFIGDRGPGGALVKRTRQFFERSPERLRLLARYSLECGILLTPVLVPYTEENYLKYQLAVMDWKGLQDNHRVGHITSREIEKCVTVHRSLLSCAEEVCYPNVTIFLNMLEESGKYLEYPWQKTWREYLLKQLAEGKSIEYSEAALLWTVLFPEAEARKHLVTVILSDFFSNDRKSQQRNSQRFITMIGKDFPSLREPEHLRNIRSVWYLLYIGCEQDLKNLREPEGLQRLPNLPDLQNLRQLLLTYEVAEKARQKLFRAELGERAELLTIQLGRILSIEESNEASHDIELEMERIARLAIYELKNKNDLEASLIPQEILSCFPTRTKNEIEFMLQIAEEVSDRRIQQLCAVAINRAKPQTAEAWTSLEFGLTSNVEEIRQVVDARLKQRSRKNR